MDFEDIIKNNFDIKTGTIKLKQLPDDMSAVKDTQKFFFDLVRHVINQNLEYNGMTLDNEDGIKNFFNGLEILEQFTEMIYDDIIKILSKLYDWENCEIEIVRWHHDVNE